MRMAAQPMPRWLMVPGMVREEEGIGEMMVKWEVTEVIDGE